MIFGCKWSYAARKRAYYGLFLQSSSNLQKLRALFQDKHTENARKFFEDFQSMAPADLPTDRHFVQTILQILGEEWFALLAIRKVLPVLSKGLTDLATKLPNDPKIRFLKTFQWDLNNIVEITAMHDRYVANA